MVAGFAPYVSEMVYKRDKIALGIIEESAEYILSTINSIKKHFTKKPRISILGGTVLAGKLYTDLISNNITGDIFTYPGYQVAIGGILILMEKLIKGPMKTEYKKYLNTIL